MADDKDKKDIDDEEAEGEGEGEGKVKSKKNWVLIGVVSLLVVILLGGTTVGGLYFAGVFDSEEAGDTKKAKKDDEEDDTEDEDDDSEDEEDSEGDEEEEGDDAPKAAIYIPIESTFVVNFEGATRVRFLQVTVELMTRDETVVDAVKTHMPVIRNNLTFLFSGRTYEQVNSIEGKELLRADALKEVQTIMETETGKSSVEAMYFTSFVTQ